MWIDRLLSSRTRRATELAAHFAEQRQRVLAQNVANIDTPNYHAQRLDRQAFEQSLREALRTSDTTSDDLRLRGKQVQTNARGGMTVTPLVEPASNAMLHDGTNARLETLMTDAQDNAMFYGLVTNVLGGQYERLMTAIRGRST